MAVDIECAGRRLTGVKIQLGSVASRESSVRLEVAARTRVLCDIKKKRKQRWKIQNQILTAQMYLIDNNTWNSVSIHFHLFHLFSKPLLFMFLWLSHRECISPTVKLGRAVFMGIKQSTKMRNAPAPNQEEPPHLINARSYMYWTWLCPYPTVAIVHPSIYTICNNVLVIFKAPSIRYKIICIHVSTSQWWEINHWSIHFLCIF